MAIIFPKLLPSQPLLNHSVESAGTAVGAAAPLLLLSQLLGQTPRADCLDRRWLSTSLWLTVMQR